jgi:antitoxin component of MazEF toxin-antitoxin module
VLLVCYFVMGKGYFVSVAKTRRVGGSLVVTIPKKLIDSKKIKEGELVEISVRKVRIDGFGAFRMLKSFTVEDELKAHD